MEEYSHVQSHTLDHYKCHALGETAAASTYVFTGTSTETGVLLAQVLQGHADLYVELNFDDPAGITTNDPAIVLSSRYVLGSFPDVGLCYSDSISDDCSDVVDFGMQQPLLEVDEVDGLSFDAEGTPVDGTIVLGSFTRSPFPTTLMLNFTNQTWQFNVGFGAEITASGSLATVPLPAGVWLLLSACAALRLQRPRRRA